MIKINLLPKSIYEKKIVKNTAVLFGVLVVAILAIGVLYTQMVLVPQVQQEEDLATQTEALEKEVIAIEGERDEWLAKIPPVKNKLTFINNVLEYNKKYPKLYEDISKWTYEKICYTGLACDGTQVSMSARARSLDDLGRYLLNMYRATDLFTEVTISGVPGYPAGANSFGGGGISMPQGSPGSGPQASLAGMPAIAESVMSGPMARYISFTVNCKLKTPITAPTFSGGAAAAGGDPNAAGGAAPVAAPAGPAPGDAGGPPPSGPAGPAPGEPGGPPP
jgi:Tfp pilus assembly protein PilN